MDGKQRDKMINEVFMELAKPISVDAIQKKDFGDKSEGYNIAYLIERLNKVLYPKGFSWDFEFKYFGNDPQTLFMRDIVESTYEGKATKKETIAVRIGVSLKDNNDTVFAYKESFGGCQFINKSIGDTLKGAQTDAMKKALSYFGLGATAFKGCIDAQLKEYFYTTTAIITRTRKVLKEAHGDKLEKVTEAILMRYIRSVTKKDYNNPDDISSIDWDLLSKSLDELEDKIKKSTKKKKVSDGEKSTDRKNKVSPIKTPVDKPVESDEEPPF